MNDVERDRLAKVVWDYHHVNHELKKSDCIFILCSNDIRVADRAVELFLQQWAPLLIISGGISHQDDLLAEPWGIPPANVFADVAIYKGVPKNKIIIENKSTNTGENIAYTKRLLRSLDVDPTTVIAVQKPYMERRAFAALMRQWPGKQFIMASPGVSFESYPTDEISKETLIHLMVGDLQRIKVYPEKGFQIHQDIPVDVWEAYEKLVAAGFTKHLIR